MIKTLAHVCLLAKDLSRTQDFYCDTLGLEKKFNFIKEGQVIGFYLRIDDAHFIEVFRTQEALPTKASIAHFCLEVTDIDALRERLISKGIAVTEKKKGADQSWQVWCKDPDGIDLEFHQYTAESSQVIGTDCVVNW